MRVWVAVGVAALLAGCAVEDEPVDQALDSDGDGFTDVEEQAAGTDPHNVTSLPGMAANVTHTPVWGGLDVAIRPGAPIGWCTYNFLFFAPANGTYYVGTAAHCTDALGQRMPLAGFQDEIGTVVYDSDNATASGGNADFSLIQLDEGLNLLANPTMMNLRGPVGYTLAAEVAVGDVIEHHGYGMVFGDVQETRDREGVFSGWSGGAGRDYCSESPIWWGDSGSPIMHQDTQKAFGIVSRAGWTACTPVAQLMGATLEYIFDELAEHGWEGVELGTT
jgi:hypothetical protein